MTTTLRLCAALLILLPLGCVGDPDIPPPSDTPEDPDPNPDPDPDPDPDPVPGTVDYYQLNWQVEDASSTPNTISHDAAVIVSGDERYVVFSEPKVGELGVQDVFISKRSLGGWDLSTRTMSEGGQNAYPDGLATDDGVFVVYSGPGETDYDIHLLHGSGSTWTRYNLTTAFEDTARRDITPQIVVDDTGVMTVLYQSAVVEASGFLTDHQLRAITIDDLATPAAPVIAGVGSSVFFCLNLDAVVDRVGKVHAAIDCTLEGGGALSYVSGSGDSWSVAAFPIGGSRINYSPSLALGPDGETLHLAWSGTIECEEASSCRRVMYSRNLSVPKPISTSVAGEGFMPTLAVDDEDRPVIVFHANVGRADIMFTYASTKDNFAAPMNLTHSEDIRESSARSLGFDSDGMPYFAFEAAEAGSDPLNIDIKFVTASRQ